MFRFTNREQRSSGAPLVILSAPTLRRQEDGAPDADAPPPRWGAISFATASSHRLNAAWSPSLTLVAVKSTLWKSSKHTSCALMPHISYASSSHALCPTCGLISGESWERCGGVRRIPCARAARCLRRLAAQDLRLPGWRVCVCVCGSSRSGAGDGQHVSRRACT